MICGFHFESQCEASQSCSTAQYVSCSLRRCYSHPFSVYETPPHTRFAYLQIFTRSATYNRQRKVYAYPRGGLKARNWARTQSTHHISLARIGQRVFFFSHTFNILLHRWNQQSSSSRQSQRTNVSFVEIILEVFQNLLQLNHLFKWPL